MTKPMPAVAFLWLACPIVMLTVPSLALPQDVARSSLPSPRLHAIDPQTPQGLRELFRYTGESIVLPKKSVRVVL